MLKNFLVYQAVVVQKTVTMVAGEETVSETVLYDNVPAYYYRNNGQLKQDGLSTQTPIKTYKILSHPAFDIQEGMIFLIDYKRLLVNDVKKNFILSGRGRVQTLWNDMLTWDDSEKWEEYKKSNIDSFEIIATEI
ncbi:MAG TPA: hypothetical protein PLQ36_00630 [Candidatus Gracilibacteria bacterium]|nr:hypothetical protein [Candidatus Gracilibacteria bacterium]